MKWLGAAGFEVRFEGRLVLIDPYLSRPAEAVPRLSITRNDYKQFDLLVASHGHFDHFTDVPYLAVSVDAPVYVPRACKKDLRREWRDRHWSARKGDPDRWNALEDTRKIDLDELTIRPIRCFHEVFDLPTVASAAGRIFRKRPLMGALRKGIRAAATHPYGHGHILQLDWHDRGARMLFVGSLTRRIYGLTAENGRADIIALPYCPANRQWMKETERIIRRFQPKAVIAHHFDKFAPPITEELNLKAWKRDLQAAFPDISIYIPHPLKPFTLEDVQGGK